MNSCLLDYSDSQVTKNLESLGNKKLCIPFTCKCSNYSEKHFIVPKVFWIGLTLYIPFLGSFDIGSWYLMVICFTDSLNNFWEWICNSININLHNGVLFYEKRIIILCLWKHHKYKIKILDPRSLSGMCTFR